MLNMMIGFFKDLWKYRHQVKKQTKWMDKYIKKEEYALNPNMMMSTNLKIWLTEMEMTFGKRYCPCFEPSNDDALNKKMLCPCEFIEDEIKEYGTCHCALFGKKDLSKEGWKASSKRLMSEYQIPLNLVDGVLDTRGKPLDSRRNLAVPDAMHQLKSTLNHYKDDVIKVLVESEQEIENLEKIAKFRDFGFRQAKHTDHYEAILTLR